MRFEHSAENQRGSSWIYASHAPSETPIAPESVPEHSISPSALVSPEGYSVRTPLCISLESGNNLRVFFGLAVGRSGGGWIRWGW